MTVLSSKNFSFYEIDEEFKENFKAVLWDELSSYHAECLKWVGNAIRPVDSQWFWSGSSYCWYDKTQTHEYRVWQTVNGNLMYEDCTNDKLYVVHFN